MSIILLQEQTENIQIVSYRIILVNKKMLMIKKYNIKKQKTNKYKYKRKTIIKIIRKKSNLHVGIINLLKNRKIIQKI